MFINRVIDFKSYLHGLYFCKCYTEAGTPYPNCGWGHHALRFTNRSGAAPDWEHSAWTLKNGRSLMYLCWYVSALSHNKISGGHQVPFQILTIKCLLRFFERITKKLYKRLICQLCSSFQGIKFETIVFDCYAFKLDQTLKMNKFQKLLIRTNRIFLPQS